MVKNSRKPSDRTVQYAIRRKKVIAGEIKNESRCTSALAVNFAPSTAAHAVERIEGQLSYRQLLDEVVPQEMLAKTLKGGLEAEKTEFGSNQRVPDWPTRRMFLETAHKLRGDFVQQTEGSGTQPGVLIQNLFLQLGVTESLPK